MLLQKVSVHPNSNFRSLNGTVFPDHPDEEYLHYRQCWENYPKQFKLRDIPMHLDIEATSRCNLRCSFCDRRLLLDKGQIGDMDYSLFQHIMDQFSTKNRLWGVKFSYRGEPLLHPRLPDMVEYAKRRGVLDVYFNTNGMLLGRDLCKKLIEAGLDRISISIDGTDRESYERVRLGASFEKLIDNLKTLIDIKRTLGVAHPKIRIQSVRLPGIEPKAYAAQWENYADEVAMLEYTDESTRETGIVANWACFQLWQRMTIEWNGSVFGCNNDSLRKIYLGNAAERSVYDCWHDETLDSVRRMHMKGMSHEASGCNGCPWRTAQIRKENRRGLQ